jgi:hypothetical protein
MDCLQAIWHLDESFWIPACAGMTDLQERGLRGA